MSCCTKIDESAPPTYKTGAEAAAKTGDFASVCDDTALLIPLNRHVHTLTLCAEVQDSKSSLCNRQQTAVLVDSTLEARSYEDEKKEFDNMRFEFFQCFFPIGDRGSYYFSVIFLVNH